MTVRGCLEEGEGNSTNWPRFRRIVWRLRGDQRHAGQKHHRGRNAPMSEFSAGNGERSSRRIPSRMTCWMVSRESFSLHSWEFYF